MAASEPRYVSFPLMAGLIAVPIVFAWFLLLPGYAGSTRVAAFVYAFTVPLISLAATGLIALMG